MREMLSFHDQLGFVEGYEDPKQIDAVRLQVDLMHHELEAAHTELVEAGTSPDLIRADWVQQAARQRVVESTIADKAEGKPTEEIVQKLQTYLVLGASEGEYYGARMGQSDEFLELIAHGLHEELITANRALTGVVFLNQESARPVDMQLDKSLHILELVSGKEYRNGYQQELPLMRPGDEQHNRKERARLTSKLSPKEAIAAARLEIDVRHNSDEASRLAVAAVEKMKDLGARGLQTDLDTTGTTALLTAAHDIIAAGTQGQESSPVLRRYERVMADMLQARQPGQREYRGNLSQAMELDLVVIKLINTGRRDIAQRLISASPLEAEYLNMGRLSGLDFSDPEDYRRARDEVLVINQEKREQLERRLTAAGLDAGTISDIVVSAWSPESALDVSAEDWAKLVSTGKLSLMLDTLCKARDVAQTTAIAVACIEKYGVPAEEMPDILKYVTRYSRDEQQPKAESMAAVIVGVKEHNQHLAEVSEADDSVIFLDAADVLRPLFDKFTYPEAAFEMFVTIHPNGTRAEFKKFTLGFNGMPDYLVQNDQEFTDRYLALRNSFQGTVGLERLGSVRGIVDLREIASIDPEHLAAVTERFQGDGEHLALSRILSYVEQLSHEKGEFVDALYHSSDEFLEILKFCDSVSLLLSRTLYSRLVLDRRTDDPEYQQQRQAEITGMFEAGLKDYIEGFGAESIPTSAITIIGKILNEPDGPMLARNIHQAAAIFGEYVSLGSLRAVGQIMEGSAASVPELQELGITKTGEPGLNQLKAVLDQWNTEIFISGDMDVALVLKSPILRDYLKSLTRFEVSQYGQHNDTELQTLLTSSERSSTALRPGYESAEYDVATRNQEAIAAFEVPQDATEEWQAYREVIERALEIVPGSGPIYWDKMGSLLEELQGAVVERGERMQGGITQLQQKISNMEQAGKDATRLQEQLQTQQESLTRLSDIDFKNVEDFDIMALVTQVRELSLHNSISKKGALQTLLVAAALMKDRTEEGNLGPVLSAMGDTPDLDSIGQMVDLIGHVTNRETWSELFEGVGGQKELNTLLSIDALNSALTRAETIESAGTRRFRFIPTRGPLMELSGHIADACWASTYDSIASQFPNFTSVVIAQNPDSATRRLVGAGFLIETNSAEGEPLLVIRGLNPIENVINQLDQESFVESFTTFARDIAERQGRRLAIVIDASSGGSSTNRPQLFQYLDKRKQQLQPIPLQGAMDTTFNGYHIVNDTYLI